MKYLPYILITFLLILLLMAPLYAVNEQDEGVLYYNINAASINTDNATFNAYGTGNLSVSVTDGIYVKNSTYTDDVLYYELAISAGAIEGAIVPGDDTEVIFNDGGVFGADADFTWNKATGVLTMSDGGASISIDGINDTITATGGLLGFDDEDLMTEGEFWWVETGGGGNYTGFTAPAALTGDTIYTWMDGFPAGTYLLQSTNGGVWTWTDPATLPSATDLDAAYDNGNIIDYSGATDQDDAIILAVITADDPGTNIWLKFDGGTVGRWYSNGQIVASSVYNLGGTIGMTSSHLIVGTSEILACSGEALFNSGNNNNDLIWDSINHNGALRGDASADTISIVGTEVYIGDVDTQTPLLLADGSANYVAVDVPALAADWTWTFPVDDGAAGEVLTTPGDGTTLTWTAKTTDTNTHRLYLEFSLDAILTDDAWSELGGQIPCSSTVGWIPMRNGSITGMSCQVDPALFLGGSWDIEVYVNNAEVWSDTISSGGDAAIAYQTQAAGTDSFSAGDFISVFYNETAGSDNFVNPHVLIEITYD